MAEASGAAAVPASGEAAPLIYKINIDHGRPGGVLLDIGRRAIIECYVNINGDSEICMAALDIASDNRTMSLNAAKSQLPWYYCCIFSGQILLKNTSGNWAYPTSVRFPSGNKYLLFPKLKRIETLATDGHIHVQIILTCKGILKPDARARLSGEAFRPRPLGEQKVTSQDAECQTEDHAKSTTELLDLLIATVPRMTLDLVPAVSTKLLAIDAALVRRRSQLREVDDDSLCPICFTGVKNCVPTCGHAICGDCAPKFAGGLCPSCRMPFGEVRRIY